MPSPSPSHPSNYKLIVAYDGTQYSGWQVQPNALSIQEILQNAMRTITKEEIHLIGAGRTDAGVHALGQVAHCKSLHAHDLDRLFRSINGIIPYDIRLLNIESAPLEFHAQRSAVSKIYHYHLCLDPIVLPFKQLYCYHPRYAIDRESLREAARYFVGTHDFSSFANASHEGAASKNPIRTIMRLDVVDEEGGVRLEFQGNGFLYKMVRNIVGMLLAVASHKCTIEEMLRIFQARDRRQAPQAAPARGLFLVAVIYTSSN